MMGDDEGKQARCLHQHKGTPSVTPPLRPRWFFYSLRGLVDKAMQEALFCLFTGSCSVCSVCVLLSR